MDAELTRLLSQADRSGLTDAVWESERRMDELIVQAWRLLAPLGVDRENVARIVEEGIQKAKSA